MPANLPNELFTTINIASVGVATAAITVVTNALFMLFKLPQKWTAFCTSLLIAYIIMFIKVDQHWYDWVMAFFNACLLFCSAFGINETINKTQSPGGLGFAKRAGLIQTWLK